MDPSARDGLGDYERRLAKVTIGRLRRLDRPIEISEYDPVWPETYRRHAIQIRNALGQRAQRLEHVGSTSVPGLPAKPIIDIVLEVPDSSDELAYAPDLQDVGYLARIREPDWFEHRLFKDQDGTAQLHVFSRGCPETDRMLQFRDWLRIDGADRALYGRAKRDLASRDWIYMQQYAEAKTEVIGAIMVRAQATPGLARSSECHSGPAV